MNSAHAFSYKMWSLQAHDAVFGDFCDHNNLRMLISTLGPSSTFGRKFLTGNVFSDPDFLQDTNISPVKQCLRAIEAN